jgi:hypothetical protein
MTTKPERVTPYYACEHGVPGDCSFCAALKSEAKMAIYKADVESRLLQEWANKLAKINWLEMESLQRDIFIALSQGNIQQQEALCYLAESLEAFTWRPVASF